MIWTFWQGNEATLRSALDAAADGNFRFRISHNRKDEFGEMFDSYNRFADAIEARGGELGEAPALEATRVAPAAILRDHGRMVA